MTASKEVEVIDRKVGVGNGRRSFVKAKGLTAKESRILNEMFGENLSFKPNKDSVEIRPNSSEDTAVHVAVELEDMGFLWKNPRNLGFRPIGASLPPSVLS